MKILENRRRIAQRQKQFVATFAPFIAGYVPARPGFRGGSVDEPVAWMPTLGIWMYTEPIENRFWNIFGTGEPAPEQQLDITCQINFPLEGIDRRIAGALAEDDDGRAYVVHRGRIGGGRAGIGKRRFVEHYQGDWVEVEDGEGWTGGAGGPYRSEVVRIGALDDPDLPRHVADFVAEVARIKAGGTEPPPPPAPPPSGPGGALDGYVPLGQVRNVDEFVRSAVALDRHYMTTGSFSGPTVEELITGNPDADRGLLLFVLCAWLNLQARADVVYGTYLQQANDWLAGTRRQPPRANYEHAAVHIEKTVRTLKRRGQSMGAWFADAINRVADEHGKTSGNVYRLASLLLRDLYAVKDAEICRILARGQLPSGFSGGHAKRFWMLLMFLRRDESGVRALVGRALAGHPAGKKAVERWHDDAYFDPAECELPVDRWVEERWQGLAHRLQDPRLRARSRVDIAARARQLAAEYGVSPSAFDAILYGEW